MPVYDQWVSIYTGAYHACGVMDNGTARCWGNNNVGQAHVAYPDSKAWLQVPLLSVCVRERACVCERESVCV